MSPTADASSLTELLLPDGSIIHIYLTGRNTEGRVTTRCSIFDADGQYIYRGEGVRSGVGEDVQSRKLLLSTIGFLTHDAELYRSHMGATQPDDGYSFSEDVAAWAYMNDSELQMAELELSDESAEEET